MLLYDFDWNYAGEILELPWVSGMAQGMAISMLIREYDITGDIEKLRLLNALVNSLTKDSEYYDKLVSYKGDNVGYLSDDKNSVLNSEQFYIPRAKDFESYRFYTGWENVETIDGRRAQRYSQTKNYSARNGGWLQFLINKDDLSKLDEESTLRAKIKYFDSTDEEVLVNFYSIGARPLGLLNNTGSEEWKEKYFVLPSYYLIYGASASPKTKIVTDTLSLLSENGKIII